MKLDPAAPAERLFEGCWRVSLPDPFVPHVTSVYMLETDGSPWLVDAGADSDDSVTALRNKLEDYGTPLEDVAGCVLTHSHLDHAGGLLRWEPRHLIAHERTATEMSNLRPRSSRGREALRRMGVPESLVAEMAPMGEPVQVKLAAIEVDTKLSGQSGVLETAPGWVWHLAEGHAPGHLIFFHPESHSLLGGDQFLERWKTPYMISDPDADPFGDYLRSIELAIGLDPEAIYPSHTGAIRPAGKWLAQRRANLQQQCERARAAVQGGSLSAWDAVQTQFGGEKLKPGLVVLLLREQLAILRHLAAAGHVERREVDGVEVFGA